MFQSTFIIALIFATIIVHGLDDCSDPRAEKAKPCQVCADDKHFPKQRTKETEKKDGDEVCTNYYRKGWDKYNKVTDPCIYCGKVKMPNTGNAVCGQQTAKALTPKNIVSPPMKVVQLETFVEALQRGCHIPAEGVITKPTYQEKGGAKVLTIEDYLKSLTPQKIKEECEHYNRAPQTHKFYPKNGNKYVFHGGGDDWYIACKGWIESKAKDIVKNLVEQHDNSIKTYHKPNSNEKVDCNHLMVKYKIDNTKNGKPHSGAKIRQIIENANFASTEEKSKCCRVIWEKTKTKWAKQYKLKIQTEPKEKILDIDVCPGQYKAMHADYDDAYIKYQDRASQGSSDPMYDGYTAYTGYNYDDINYALLLSMILIAFIISGLICCSFGGVMGIFCGVFANQVAISKQRDNDEQI